MRYKNLEYVKNGKLNKKRYFSGDLVRLEGKYPRVYNPPVDEYDKYYELDDFFDKEIEKSQTKERFYEKQIFDDILMAIFSIVIYFVACGLIGLLLYLSQIGLYMPP